MSFYSLVCVPALILSTYEKPKIPFLLGIACAFSIQWYFVIHPEWYVQWVYFAMFNKESVDLCKVPFESLYLMTQCFGLFGLVLYSLVVCKQRKLIFMALCYLLPLIMSGIYCGSKRMIILTPFMALLMGFVSCEIWEN